MASTAMAMAALVPKVARVAKVMAKAVVMMATVRNSPLQVLHQIVVGCRLPDLATGTEREVMTIETLFFATFWMAVKYCKCVNSKS